MVSNATLGQLEEIFHEAVSLTEEEREERLQQFAPELRTRVRELLTADAETSVSSRASLVGETVGRYSLLEKVGEGGMGSVYRAKQQGDIRRIVAVKVIKWGMDTKEVVARFASERRALGIMNHPNIARIHDSGVTETGRPYFVMEYVPGLPITKYCDEHRLTLRERLVLFRNVCEAVQHAHQKGIIHRDLKPSNVPVTEIDGVAVPKVIDFGIAKVTDRALVEPSVHTELGQVIGTPAYMSPERVNHSQVDIDTRSDVYSLGVLLYELLTGTLPFDRDLLRSGSLEEIRQTIRSAEPPLPSVRLNDVSTNGRHSGRARNHDFVRYLRPDLDWIVRKALRKDPADRYESASALALDIRRHLEHEEVSAVPSNPLYRMRKLARRNPAFVVLFLSLILGLFGTGAGLIRANRAEDVALLAQKEAQLESGVARRVSEYVVDLFEVSDPDKSRGNTITAREILDRGVRELDEAQELDDRPEIRARLLSTIGTGYMKLGLYAEALPLLVETLTLRRNALGDDHRETLAAANDLGRLLKENGDIDSAEAYYREALDGRRRTLGNDHPDTLATIGNLAGVLRQKGDLDAAEPLYREAMEGFRRVLGNDHPGTLATTDNMGTLLQHRGDLKGATRYHRQALNGYRRVLGTDHPDTLAAINNMGTLLQRLGHLEAAEPYRREALAGCQRVLGSTHPHTILVRANLGDLYADLGRNIEAHSLLVEALDGFRTVMPEGHAFTGTTLRKHGRNLALLKRYEEAERSLLEAHQILGEVYGDGHSQVDKAIQNIIELYQAWGKPEMASAWDYKGRS